MNPELKFIGPVRGTDAHGSGEYGASRGSRIHVGVDIVAVPDSIVLSPIKGKVTKHGYPYGDDLSFRYIQITDDSGYQVRLFYVDPVTPVGWVVEVGHPLGSVQTLQGRYPGITDHVHLEVKTPAGKYIPWATYSNA